ncbi:MAG: hypothetical protein DRP47_07760 [Candidatus Zixiibacteriota bacterium]|nr:MAG: hypothetical protein DRP47_07760 [candidate division Zixibacteria bacterium]
MSYQFKESYDGLDWQVKTVVLLLLSFLIFVTVSLDAEERIVIGGLDDTTHTYAESNYPVLLALSGGGARGLATIGILRAFEENSINVVAIAGTSMGGIIGGLYAAGKSPKQLATIASNLDFTNIFNNTPARTTMFQTKRRGRGRDILTIRFDGIVPIIPKALTTGQRLTEILTNLTTRATYQSAGDFSQLHIPFAAVSTDMISGEEVVLDSGSLADAMRATMAFPLAFTGMEMNGRLLMDGGMVNPIPVDVVRTLCDSVTFTVAVNTTSPLVSRNKLITPVDIANQATSIMTTDKLQFSLATADYVITPVGDDVLSSDFKLKDSIIELGYLAGLAAVDSIKTQFTQHRDTGYYYFTEVTLSADLLPYRTQIESLVKDSFLSRLELVSVLRTIKDRFGFFQIEATIKTLDFSEPEAVLHLNGFRFLNANKVTFSFIGNQVFSDSTIIQCMDTADSIISPQQLHHILQSFLDLYRANEYDLMNIRDVKIEPDAGLITVTIDEAVVRGIEIEGNERTQSRFIKSLFPVKIGEPYSTRRAAQGITNIYGTDLFHRVSVDLIPKNGQAVVKIRVQEKKPSQMRLGWHWDDEYESEEFIELLDDNIGGAGLELLGHARYSPDRQNYFISFKADRIFSTYMTSTMRFYHTRFNRHLYNDSDSLTGKHQELKLGVEFCIGRQISRLGTVTAALIIEENDYNQEDKNIDEEFGLRILKLESLVENFDRIPFPQTGKKHYFELKLAGRFLGGDIDYTRFFTSIEAYFPLGKYLNYHPRLGVGISRSGLPQSEQFYIGGLRSFHGYRTDQLNGDKMFLLSQELRIKLPLWIYLSAYFDLGDVYGSTDEIKLSNLRHAFGVMISLDSPLGPFEIGYGIADNDIDRVYVRVGFEF